jgi:hypothetical protein
MTRKVETMTRGGERIACASIVGAVAAVGAFVVGVVAREKAGVVVVAAAAAGRETGVRSEAGVAAVEVSDGGGEGRKGN